MERPGVGCDAASTGDGAVAGYLCYWVSARYRRCIFICLVLYYLFISFRSLCWSVCVSIVLSVSLSVRPLGSLYVFLVRSVCLSVRLSCLSAWLFELSYAITLFLSLFFSPFHIHPTCFIVMHGQEQEFPSVMHSHGSRLDSQHNCQVKRREFCYFLLQFL